MRNPMRVLELHRPNVYRRDGSEVAETLDLGDLLMKLPLRDREIVALRYGVGLTSSEIAAVVGGTAVGVRSRLHRVLAHLREELTKDD